MVAGAHGEPGASVLGHVVQAFQPIRENVIIQGKIQRSGSVQKNDNVRF